jgi:hypothetical protein
MFNLSLQTLFTYLVPEASIYPWYGCYVRCKPIQPVSSYGFQFWAVLPLLKSFYFFCFTCQSSLRIWWNSICERWKFTMLKKLFPIEMHFGKNKSSPCTAWKFIFGIPKSYSLSKFTLIGRKFTLYCTEVHFNTSWKFIFLSKLTLVKTKNNFCQNGSSPCTAWKLTFDMTKIYSLSKFTLARHKFSLYHATVHFKQARNLRFVNINFEHGGNSKFIFCQY